MTRWHQSGGHHGKQNHDSFSPASEENGSSLRRGWWLVQKRRPLLVLAVVLVFLAVALVVWSAEADNLVGYLIAPVLFGLSTFFWLTPLEFARYTKLQGSNRTRDSGRSIWLPAILSVIGVSLATLYLIQLVAKSEGESIAYPWIGLVLSSIMTAVGITQFVVNYEKRK